MIKAIKYIFIYILIFVGFIISSNLHAQFTIDPGGLVSIKNGTTMQINMDLKINAIDGSSGYFSDQTLTLGDIDVTGDVSIERYMVADIWHNVAAPVSAETSSVYAGTDMIWYYDETLIMNDWEFGWVWQPTGALSVPRGYDVIFYTTDVLVDYTGTGSELNTGSFTIGVTNTNSTPSEIPAHKGWNLVGNPYPSPVDWQASSGWNKSNINDAKYIWDGDNDIYTIWLGGGAPIGVNGGTQYIPSNQGYWVQATTTGNFGFNNAVRTGFMTATPDFYKSQEILDYPLLSLVASNESHSDETIVRFIEGNTEKLDINYDATKLFNSNENIPQISLISGDEIMAVNTYDQIENDLEIPMNFKCAQSGYYSIEISDRTNLLTTNDVYLKDMIDNKMINLSQEYQYDFYHDPFNADERFKIYFNPTTDIINNLQPENYFTVYSNRDKVILVKNSTKELNGEVLVYNMHGQNIFSKSLISSKFDSFTINGPSGYYIVHIRTDQTVNNSKIVILK